MDSFEKLEQIFKEPITIDNINRINDCFIRYLFSAEGSEAIVLSFINSVMKNLDFETFVKVEILNPFSLSKYLKSKESIMDIRCVTESGQVVIIEIQLQGNSEFIYRSLFYWAKGYSVMLDRGENYNKLQALIIINILDFKLIENIDDIHTCYVLKEIKHNNILTDHCQIHYLELPKFNNNTNIKDIKKEFLSWLKFFKGEDMKSLLKEDTVFESVKEKSESFLCDNPLIDTYKRKEIDEYFNKRMLDYEIKNAMNKGIQEGIESGIEQGIEQGIKQGIEKGIEQGIEKGIEQGIEQSKIEIARNLKKSGIDIKIISDNTGLSIEQIEKL
ncbi:Rpn family recombination-promoting nuclease/putative transposase [Brachyspira intermedia]|uniref:Rpn family recombination-promoting nuclease/putative transposase n=1 Tax=Brachyspira intermedia TaxID=84377 RepID=UPI0030047B81